jgi:hypothetical protein
MKKCDLEKTIEMLKAMPNDDLVGYRVKPMGDNHYCFGIILKEEKPTPGKDMQRGYRRIQDIINELECEHHPLLLEIQYRK